MFKKFFDKLDNLKSKEQTNDDIHITYQKANEYYLKANELGDNGNLVGAIEMYSKALD